MTGQPVPWQPIVGCSYVSAGCKNCKAVGVSGGLGVTRPTTVGEVWDNSVRLMPDRLAIPFQTEGARDFVVCPHSDLFHEGVPDEWIDAVIAEIRRSKQHFFQIGTKRAGRMRDYFRKNAVPPNGAVGVSCERQQEADEKIPLLLDIPARLRIVTLYPMLGKIDLRSYLETRGIGIVAAGMEVERPINARFVDSVREQCEKFGVRFVHDNRIVD